MHGKLFVLLIVSALTGCRNRPDSETSPWIGKPLPAFSFPLLRDGDSIRSADLVGKVSLVTFWATWCPSCMQEVPFLKGVHKTYGPKGLRMVALSVDQQPELVAPLAERMGMGYPIATGAEVYHMNLGLQYIPHTFLLDSTGIVRASFTGNVDREELSREIERLGLR